MSFIIKIIFCLSIALTTGFTSCGLSFAQDQDQAAQNIAKVDTEETKVKGEIVQGQEITSAPFETQKSEQN